MILLIVYLYINLYKRLQLKLVVILKQVRDLEHKNAKLTKDLEEKKAKKAKKEKKEKEKEKEKGEKDVKMSKDEMRSKILSQESEISKLFSNIFVSSIFIRMFSNICLSRNCRFIPLHRCLKARDIIIFSRCFRSKVKCVSLKARSPETGCYVFYTNFTFHRKHIIKKSRKNLAPFLFKPNWQ